MTVYQPSYDSRFRAFFGAHGMEESPWGGHDHPLKDSHYQIMHAGREVLNRENLDGEARDDLVQGVAAIEQGIRFEPEATKQFLRKALQIADWTFKLEEIRIGERDLDQEITRQAESRGEHHEPIMDGVVDGEFYVGCSPKILWILKEPWEKAEGDEQLGGWSVTKNVAATLDHNHGTLPMMAYITHSVFNGGLTWDEVPWVTDDPAVACALKRVAYINISKQPGPTRSNPAAIERAFAQNKELLLRQVALLGPDVIIGGSTLAHFFESFGLTEEMFNKDGIWWCIQNGRLFIHAYHPAQRSEMPKEAYFAQIVEIILNHSPKPIVP